MEKSLRFDSLETNRLDTFGHNIEDRLRNIHKEFPSNVKAKDGVYGIQEIQKENGLVERIGRNEQNNVYKEYFTRWLSFILGGKKLIQDLGNILILMILGRCI